MSFILLACFINCNRHKTINGIYISELLLLKSKELHINYCKLLDEATKGNNTSIKQLSLLEFYDGVGYDHGAVIVDMIEIIGEDKFIQSITTISDQEKYLIKGYIEVGLEYGNNPKLEHQMFKNAFPKIYNFITTPKK